MTAEELSRRVKLLRITPELLVSLLRVNGERRFKIEGMPADAVILACADGWTLVGHSLEIMFKVASYEFPEVPHGCKMPELILTATEIRDEPKRGREFI